MSTKIVSNSTMDRVVHAILDRCNVFAGIDATDRANASPIGLLLYEMNVAAVNVFYKRRNKRPAYRWQEPTYPFEHSKLGNQYRAIETLLYECDEGTISESDLFRDLTELGNRMASDLAHENPSVKNAPWGWPARPE